MSSTGYVVAVLSNLDPPAASRVRGFYAEPFAAVIPCIATGRRARVMKQNRVNSQAMSRVFAAGYSQRRQLQILKVCSEFSGPVIQPGSSRTRPLLGTNEADRQRCKPDRQRNHPGGVVHMTSAPSHNDQKAEAKQSYTEAVALSVGKDKVRVDARCEFPLTAPRSCKPAGRLEKVRYARSKSCVEQQAHQKPAHVSNPARSLRLRSGSIGMP